MTADVVIRCECGGNVRFEHLDVVPPPPGALLGIGGPPPGEWKGWKWVCESCGSQCGITYDYGTLDLGHGDPGDENDFEVLG